MNIRDRELLPAKDREVQAPEIFETRNRIENFHHVGHAALARRVVHQGHARLQAIASTAEPDRI